MAMEQRVAWITGAGSGMGRASAMRLARRGFAVALSGRRAAALTDVQNEIDAEGGRSIVVPLDVTDASAVDDARTSIESDLGTVTDLVLSAGLNAPNRYWRDLAPADVERIVSTNLIGTVNVAHTTLAGMRERGEGTIVFISSRAGWRFSPHAGVAYSASKSALSSLAESLNDQENAHGVRACNLCPGDVDSDFLDMRPRVPDEQARRAMLTAEDIADAVEFVVASPAHVCVNELVVSPVKKDVVRQ